MHEGKFETLTVAATEDLSGAQFKVVDVDGTIAADTTLAAGILRNKPASGSHASVGYFGRMKGYAAAAITNGARLTVTTSGFLTVATSAQIDGGFVVGKALAAANSGDLFPAIFNFAR